jgi:sulfate adenylyltransferase
VVDNSLSPHGGQIVQRVLEPARARERIQGLQTIAVSDQIARECIDIAYGFFSPIEGFMTSADVDCVVKEMRLASGYVWSIPIVFDISDEEIAALGLTEADSVLFTYQGQPLAVLEVHEIYSYDRQEMARHVYGTTEEKHPGVARTYAQKDRLLGGPITLVTSPTINPPFDRFWYTPRQLRSLIAERSWTRVIAHQTRNVPHTGHEWLMKGAWFAGNDDAILVSAVIGEKKVGDYIDEAIVLGHDALRTGGYFQDDVHLTSIFLWDMRYAGPREAVLHALVRKNLGCTHHMFGRDHAGVGAYYGTYAAHEIFEQLPDIGITPVKTLEWFHCPACGGPAYEAFCAHGDQRQPISGTWVRSIIDKGEQPEGLIFRPDVFDLVMECATKYGFESPFVTERYLQDRNPILTIPPLP